MSFNSYLFFAFLTVVILLYRLLPWRYGKFVLLIASYLFYGNANPWYCILLFISTITDYSVAIQIHKSIKDAVRKRWLWVSILMNIGLLAVFKYADFFILNYNWGLNFFGFAEIPYLNFILPIGISFYTFQTLSYTIDIYRNKTKLCPDFFNFSLYVSYFPQLVAGPIERAGDLIPQLAKKHKVSKELFMHGIERILWGLIKKIVFADRLAVFINEVYFSNETMYAPAIALAMFGFMFQIYLDFSAYSDIAIGIARLMGVRLSENFNYPLVARNAPEFWNRWHITLTQWFKDYVYFSMGGSRRSAIRVAFNTFATFLLIGFWHGAAWNFVLFGTFAGLTQICYHVIRGVLGLRKHQNILGTKYWSHPLGNLFNILLASWMIVFFRAPDLETIFGMFGGLVNNQWSIPSYYYVYAVLIGFLYAVHIARSLYIPKIRRGEITINYNKTVTNAALVIILIFFGYDYQETFIYFQF